MSSCCGPAAAPPCNLQAALFEIAGVCTLGDTKVDIMHIGCIMGSGASLSVPAAGLPAPLSQPPVLLTCTTPGPCCATLMGLRLAPRGCVATASVSTLCRGPAAASSGAGAGHQSRAHTGPPANNTLSTANVASVAPAAACWLSIPTAAACADGSDTVQLHSSTPRELNSGMRWLSADRGSLMDTDSGWQQKWQRRTFKTTPQSAPRAVPKECYLTLQRLLTLSSLSTGASCQGCTSPAANVQPVGACRMVLPH